MTAAPTAAKNPPAAETLRRPKKQLEEVKLLWAEERVRNQRQVTDMNAEAAQLKETINARAPQLYGTGSGRRAGAHGRWRPPRTKLRQLKSTANALRDQLPKSRRPAKPSVRSERSSASSRKRAERGRHQRAARRTSKRQKAGEAERTRRALADAAAEVAQLKGSMERLAQPARCTAGTRPCMTCRKRTG